MRLAAAIPVVVVLFWSFVQAPFLHVHAGDHDHDHNHAQNAGPAHMHMRGHHLSPLAAPQFVAEDDDDDAVDLIWSISSPVGITLHFTPALTGWNAPPPSPALSGVSTNAITLHSRDPPDSAPPQLRGPPA